MNQFKTTAIIVTYFPNNQTITKTIKSIVKQVSKLLIIDNTPNGGNVFKNHKLLDRKNNVELITLNENVGIAKAQNIGIRRALENKADFILLSDQDTFILITILLRCLKHILRLQIKKK
jgi:rhamnosyltransferase